MSQNKQHYLGNKPVVLGVINLFSQDEAHTVRLKRLRKQPWRTFYSTFVPKAKRKLAQQHANILQKQHVAKLWDIFLDHYFDAKLDHFQLKAKKQFADQKIIWQYWGQGLTAAQQNETVRLCFTSVDQYKTDYQVIRLDEESVKDYLDLPDFIWEKKKNAQFKPAFFADLIRLALLDCYGGVWIDATILLTAPIAPVILQQDFFMFHRHQDALNKMQWQNFNSDYFGWGKEHVVNVLNSFIVAKKNNKIVHTCFEIMMNFWKTQKDIPHYFIFQIMFNELGQRNIFEREMIVVDDTLPHLLQIRLKEKFNEYEFMKIVNHINIHKINYINTYSLDSYYGFLIRKYTD